jgi:hypothetical protein
MQKNYFKNQWKMNPHIPTQCSSIISPDFVFSVLYFSFVPCNYTTKMMVIQGCSLKLTILFILSIWSAASVPDILSRSVPGLLPRSVPDILSRSDPDILSRSVPDTLSRSDPDILSRSVPELLLRSVSDIDSRSVPGLLPRSVLDILPRSVPELLPRSVPDNLSRSRTASKFVIPKTPDKVSKWPFRKSSIRLLKFFSS